VPTVDGRDWAEKRLRFLEGLLADNPSDEQRAAIEAELTELRARRGWLPRWLRFPRLPHER
jgi:hypothetical protein